MIDHWVRVLEGCEFNIQNIYILSFQRQTFGVKGHSLLGINFERLLNTKLQVRF